MTPLAYVKLGVIAAGAFSLLSGALWMRNVVRERDELRTSLDEARSANEEQTRALKAVIAQREYDSEVTAKLASRLRTVTARERVVSRQLAEMERTDADVRAYLNRDVPAALRCVLSDEGCHEAGGGEAAPAESPAGPVPTPSKPGAAEDFRPGGVLSGVEECCQGVRGYASCACRLAPIVRSY